MKEFLLLLLAMLALQSAGCQKRQAKSDTGILAKQQQCEWFLAEVFDFGGGNRDLVLNPDGRAFKYAKAAKDAFYRKRAGEQSDRIFLSMIGGPKTAPRWLDLHPSSFRKQFPSSEAFQSYLAANAKLIDAEANSYEGIAQALDYICRFGGGRKTATLIFSESRNTASDKEQAHQRLVESLRAYMKRPGSQCRFCWVAWEAIPELEKVFSECGLTSRDIVPDAQHDPMFDDFEE
ncbi:MAG: hypothetical protein ACJ8C4_16495 [Gemmataceae bacterium]